jgi:hypothetical protein
MKYMIKYVMVVTVILFAVNNLSAQYQLVKKWETDSLLKVPESVLYDSANEVLYVSNIDGKPDEKDGKGSIGKVGLDGKIITVDWVTGLNAPKGMAMVKNILWVADVDELAAIDLTTATIIKRIKINGAKFLNDVAADKDGNIYVSDSQTKMVHKVQNDQPSVFLDNLEGPNGVLVYNKSIYLLDNGKFYKVGKGKKLIKIADGLEGHTDGVEHVEGNDFIVSCWEGVIWYVKGDGSKQKLLDTRDQKINSADIGYDAKNKVVFVPTFFKNSVAAYQLQ